MTLFFFVVALELKRELVLGELRNPRMAALSIAAAAGGMLVPAGIYVVMQWGQEGAHGWGIAMATDTAFVIGCLAVFGRRIPQSLRVFMLSLAIVDDIGAILVVAIGYGGPLDFAAMAFGGLGIAIVLGMGLLGIRSIPMYFLVGGLTWLAVDASGIHATVTGVILGLLTPTRRWVSDERLRAILDRVVAYPADHWSGATEDRKALRLAEVAARETLSPVERLEIMLHPWVGFVIMPLFAFANAGVPISAAHLRDPIAAAVFFGLTLGKPLGVISFSWLAVRSGIALRPPSLDWGMVAGGGMLAGIGFTMALFIAGLAFGDDHLNAAKLGILSASIVSAVLGSALLAWLSSSRRVGGVEDRRQHDVSNNRPSVQLEKAKRNSLGQLNSQREKARLQRGSRSTLQGEVASAAPTMTSSFRPEPRYCWRIAAIGGWRGPGQKHRHGRDQTRSGNDCRRGFIPVAWSEDTTTSGGRGRKFFPPH
jgi:NhaA family Na+:H+ antiporter